MPAELLADFFYATERIRNAIPTGKLLHALILHYNAQLEGAKGQEIIMQIIREGGTHLTTDTGIESSFEIVETGEVFLLRTDRNREGTFVLFEDESGLPEVEFICVSLKGNTA